MEVKEGLNWIGDERWKGCFGSVVSAFQRLAEIRLTPFPSHTSF